jgi:hypothetical protein
VGAKAKERLTEEDGCISHLPPWNIVRDLVHMDPYFAVFWLDLSITAFANFGNAIPDTQHFRFQSTDQSTHRGHIQAKVHARKTHLNLKNSTPFTAAKTTLSKALTVEEFVHALVPLSHWRVILKE